MILYLKMRQYYLIVNLDLKQILQKYLKYYIIIVRKNLF